ncbi:MAG: tyrosine-type recombinase/integrase [bacterium]|nr:tyrosine-type recombinase/integrase [bacterium]
MLAEICPRAHARYASLPILGPYLDDFVVWLRSQGYPHLPIYLRIRAAKQLDALLQRDAVARLEELSPEGLLAYAPASSQDDIYRAALVHSLVRYLGTQGALAPSPSTPACELTASYCRHIQDTRGLAASTVKHHCATVREFLAFLGNRGQDQLDASVRSLDIGAIEDFLKVVAQRLSRQSLQHTVSHLRSFLRFLTTRGLAPVGLDGGIDTPRVYRDERLPRALPWETVLALLRAIDRSTPMGRRDYAMLLLTVTYGLRTCEVVSLKLDDIEWRDGWLRVTRSKVRAPIMLPLTEEVGAAILSYLQDGRPALGYREIFLRVRAPAGTLKPTAVTEAFQCWVRRSGLCIPFQGPHCLRHSLALHLLRQGTPLKTIGDLLGHRSTESTCLYLRLHVEDLRDVALELPSAACQEMRR